MAAAMTPHAIPAWGLMYPLLGVAATRPAMAPEHSCSLALSTMESHPYNRPLFFQSVIHEYPCHCSCAPSQIGHQKGHDSSKIRAQSRPRIKSKPSEPQESCAEHNVGDAMRPM